MSQDSQTSTPVKEPKLLDQVRAAIRTKHYSIKTEEAYLHWIKKYIFLHNKRHPKDMGEKEINHFITHFGCERKSFCLHTKSSFVCNCFFSRKSLESTSMNCKMLSEQRRRFYLSLIKRIR